MTLGRLHDVVGMSRHPAIEVTWSEFHDRGRLDDESGSVAHGMTL